jgi:hypothetical protein
MGVEKMSHFRLAGHVTGDALFHFTIRFCLALVLTKMFCPRMHQEYLHKPIGHFGVAIDSPLIRTVATPSPGIFADRLDKLYFVL